MSVVLPKLGEALLMAIGMFWTVAWSLSLGFIISSLLQVVVSREHMQKTLGRDGLWEVARASFWGIASSSCSFASAAITRTLFKKGAALVPALAFLLASTNLVVELGVVIYLLLGWQFALAEWTGGLMLIGIMAGLVRLTYPTALVFSARQHPEDHAITALDDITDERPFALKLRDPEIRIRIAHHFVSDFSMLWKDLVIGFLIAGVLSSFVPDEIWRSFFLKGAPPLLQVPTNAVLGVLVAVLSFVCSIGNVPMAAVLWGSGISFGGVLAFLYADLLVLPLLDVYRRYFGLKMAAYIAAVFFVTMVASALVMDFIFQTLGLIPLPNTAIRQQMTTFSVNYTFWLNLVFGALSVYLFFLARRNPVSQPNQNECCH